MKGSGCIASPALNTFAVCSDGLDRKLGSLALEEWIVLRLGFVFSFSRHNRVPLFAYGYSGTSFEGRVDILPRSVV